jgi:hypothetical protein
MKKERQIGIRVGLPDLFREFDEAVKTPEEKPGLRLVHTKELSS